MHPSAGQLFVAAVVALSAVAALRASEWGEADAWANERAAERRDSHTDFRGFEHRGLADHQGFDREGRSFDRRGGGFDGLGRGSDVREFSTRGYSSRGARSGGFGGFRGGGFRGGR